MEWTAVATLRQHAVSFAGVFECCFGRKLHHGIQPGVDFIDSLEAGLYQLF